MATCTGGEVCSYLIEYPRFGGVIRNHRNFTWVAERNEYKIYEYQDLIIKKYLGDIGIRSFELVICFAPSTICLALLNSSKLKLSLYGP